MTGKAAMGPFQPAASARVAMHCGARADAEWEWARGAGGRGGGYGHGGR